MRWLAALLLIAGCANPLARFRPDQGAFLLDVRSPGEFAEGHVAGAVNVPINELEATISSLPADRNRQIVVYCPDGTRRSRARNLLLNAGFANVTAGR